MKTEEEGTRVVGSIALPTEVLNSDVRIPTVSGNRKRKKGLEDSCIPFLIFLYIHLSGGEGRAPGDPRHEVGESRQSTTGSTIAPKQRFS